MEIEGVKRIEQEPQGPVNIIVAGAGDVSRHYLDHFRDNPNTHVVGISDAIPERAAQRALEYGVGWIGSFEELLRYGNADLFVNLTPPHVHSQLNIAAMEAGVHVYSEKPMATTLRDAWEQMKVSERQGSRLGIAPETFLTPTFQLARRIIDGQVAGITIGTPEFMRISFTANGPEEWSEDPERFYGNFGGPMPDMSHYYTHNAINLFGPICSVSAEGSVIQERSIQNGPRKGEAFRVANGVYTTMRVSTKFESGLEAEMEYSFDGKKSEPHFVIFGESGAIRLPDPNSYDRNPIEISRQPYWVDDEDRVWESIYPADPGVTVVRGFAAADFAQAAKEGRPHQLDAQLGFQAIDITIASIESANYNGMWVDLNTTATRPEPYNW